MPDSTNPEWTRFSRLTKSDWQGPRGAGARRVALGLGWLATIGLVALASAAAPNGHEHGNLAQFFGRLHPTVLHVPIGLILLVPVLEVWGRVSKRAGLVEAAGVVLGLGTGAAVLAAADGWLLAWSGGYKGGTVLWHLWGGIAFAGMCVVAATVRGKLTQIYGVALFVTLGVMVWASHLGGSLSHGDNYLTQYLPGRLKALFHVAPAKVAVASAAGTGAATVYGKVIQPIFNHSCVSCHGPEKVKGGFKLDTFAHLMKGGDNGDDVVPWNPVKSEVLRRVRLDPDDDDFMPSNGKNALTEEQKALVEKWIMAGASDLQPLLDR